MLLKTTISPKVTSKFPIISVTKIVVSGWNEQQWATTRNGMQGLITTSSSTPGFAYWYFYLQPDIPVGGNPLSGLIIQLWVASHNWRWSCSGYLWVKCSNQHRFISSTTTIRKLYKQPTFLFNYLYGYISSIFLRFRTETNVYTWYFHVKYELGSVWEEIRQNNPPFWRRIVIQLCENQYNDNIAITRP